ncbi:MAG TPA: helix-turn-helix transcriptional regulator [Myxococcota bacterium]|nr:helix-turn-helix transcriptional regulator [Myxococcota bacterium]
MDIASDLLEHADLGHVALELLVAVVAIGGVIYYSRLALRERRQRQALVLELSNAHDELSSAQDERERLRAEALAWRKEATDAVNGLAHAIDRQFERWSLTGAEREVALLLLKGLSHKEVATARGTSERTVRQQSLMVYKKAGVTGRAELSAFFLEDLLDPARHAASVSGPAQGDGAINT